MSNGDDAWRDAVEFVTNSIQSYTPLQLQALTYVVDASRQEDDQSVELLTDIRLAELAQQNEEMESQERRHKAELDSQERQQKAQLASRKLLHVLVFLGIVVVVIVGFLIALAHYNQDELLEMCLVGIGPVLGSAFTCLLIFLFRLLGRDGDSPKPPEV